MRLSERYISEYLAPETEKARLVLSTLDSAKFYQKIGYEPCYPMTKTKHSPMSEMYIGNQGSASIMGPDPLQIGLDRLRITGPGSTLIKTVSTCDSRADIYNKVQGSRPILAS